MEKTHIIIGGGGHALSIANALLSQDLPVFGFTAPKKTTVLALNIKWLGTDKILSDLNQSTILVCNGIGSTSDPRLRRDTYLRIKEAGYEFAHVQHRNANISPLIATIGESNQMLSGCIINAHVSLGKNNIVNSGVIIEHGCHIGSHCHIAPGAVLCGDVELADDVHIGAGATVIQGIKIGAGAVIAAGAVVTQNVEPLTLVSGVPAQLKRKIDPT